MHSKSEFAKLEKEKDKNSLKRMKNLVFQTLEIKEDE